MYGSVAEYCFCVRHSTHGCPLIEMVRICRVANIQAVPQHPMPQD